MGNDGNSFEQAFRGTCVLRNERSSGWVGIWLDNFDRYWLVEGKPGSTEPCRDLCHFESYSEALKSWGEWWEREFDGEPTKFGLQVVQGT
ncbi:MAG TPA: hypothetical protein VFO51_01855 [Sphingomicrobium sp.]|nr:hypothetical protein [Sphingomicrobium sp.]